MPLAKSIGANAVLNVRFATTSIAIGAGVFFMATAALAQPESPGRTVEVTVEFTDAGKLARVR